MLNDSPTTGSAWTRCSTGVFYINTTVAVALRTSDRSECVGLFGALSSWYTLNSSIAFVRELLLWQSRRENDFTGMSNFHSLAQCHCVQYEYYIHFNHHCTLSSSSAHTFTAHTAGTDTPNFTTIHGPRSKWGICSKLCEICKMLCPKTHEILWVKMKHVISFKLCATARLY